MPSPISMMIIDMKAPGVEVRPIRQISGFSHFNEVFLEDVFVPDEDVVGPVRLQTAAWVEVRGSTGPVPEGRAAEGPVVTPAHREASRRR